MIRKAADTVYGAGSNRQTARSVAAGQAAAFLLSTCGGTRNAIAARFQLLMAIAATVRPWRRPAAREPGLGRGRGGNPCALGPSSTVIGNPAMREFATVGG